MCVSKECSSCTRKLCEGVDDKKVCDVCEDIKESKSDLTICKLCGQRFCERCGRHGVCFVCRKFNRPKAKKSKDEENHN